jgi:chromate transporter
VARILVTQAAAAAPSTEATVPVSLGRLFLIFLRIGCTTWGGFMAFIAVVSKSLTARKLASDEDITDAIMVAQMLPGPVAVDMSVAIGYRLRGLAGAAVSWLGAVLPSFIVVTTLSLLYLKFGKNEAVTRVFMGFRPAVVAIILVAAYEMGKKQVKSSPQAVIAVLAAVAILVQSVWFSNAWWVTLAVVALTALAGWLLYANPSRTTPAPKAPPAPSMRSFVPLFAFAAPVTGASLILKIFLTFAGMSLVLFGGGYLFIPIIQSALVNNQHWLTADEFSAGLALTQITPGPILMTAAFVGAKLAGIPGAVAGMLGMFGPPAILTVIVAHGLNVIKKSTGVTAALRGVRPAVVGMIFAAGIVLGQQMPHDSVWHIIASALILIAALFAILRLRVEVALIIPLAGIAGFFLFLR